LEGEARHVGTALASIVMEAITSGNPMPRPVIILAGGETTVEVSGRGKGGRNQELVLSASASINGGRGVAVASIGTDGIDGPTDAAGAIVDGSTFQRGLDLGVNPEKMLTENDSYRFFQKVGGHIITGPTYTNVNDLTVLVAV
jgi:glycerate 2-kinase